MSIGRKRRDKVREEQLEAAGVSIVKHTEEAALEESQEQTADAMFGWDDIGPEYDVEDEPRRLHVRFAIDMEIVWSEPPAKNKEVVFDTVKSFLLKSLAQHKYLQFTGITIRGQIVDGK